jgi:uncharacterized protein
MRKLIGWLAAAVIACGCSGNELSLLNLPYRAAEMTVERGGTRVDYQSARSDDSGARFDATYEPMGDVFRPGNGTLEHFLTERYCLYNLGHGRGPYRLDIHHPPWPLQRAHAEIGTNTMLDINGLKALDTGAPLLHFVKRQDMVAWGPSPVSRLDAA